MVENYNTEKYWDVSNHHDVITIVSHHVFVVLSCRHWQYGIESMVDDVDIDVADAENERNSDREIII
jgi:hypothetical protein